MNIKSQLNLLSIAIMVVAITSALCNHNVLELFKEQNKVINILYERIYKLEHPTNQ